MPTPSATARQPREGLCPLPKPGSQTKEYFPPKGNHTRMRIFLILLLLLTPVWADIPITPEQRQQGLQLQLDRELQDLPAAEQRAKVQQLLADMPRRKAELDKQIQEAQSHPNRSGPPAYMLGKQRTGLDYQEKFYQDWLQQHKDDSFAPPPGVVSPSRAIGWLFLAGGLLLVGRRVLRRAPSPA